MIRSEIVKAVAANKTSEMVRSAEVLVSREGCWWWLSAGEFVDVEERRMLRCSAAEVEVVHQLTSIS